jgi:hypothetical protein
MKLYWAAVLAVVAFCTAGPRLFAQGGPPLRTDDPGTPGNGNWEINVAVTSEKINPNWRLNTPLLDMNYGVGDHVQLKLEIPWVVETAAQAVNTGLGNSIFGVKWRFADQEKLGVSISTYPQFIANAPSASVRRGLAEPGWQIELPLEVAGAIRKFEVTGEAGYIKGQRLPDSALLGLALGYPVTEKWELLAEVHLLAARRFSERELVFALGGRRKLTGLCTLLFSAGRSLPGSSGGQPAFFSYIGLQFAF